MSAISKNNITHDKASLDPVHSMKVTREALSLLELPGEHARILPGHGWRPVEFDCIKINSDEGISMDARMGGVGARCPIVLGLRGCLV